MNKYLSIIIVILCLAGCTTTRVADPGAEIKDAPKDPAIEYQKLGIAYMQQGTYDIAEDRLLQSIKIRPTAESLNALALLYENMHDNLSAEKTYEKLVTTFPDFLLGYSNYNVFLCKYDRWPRMDTLLVQSSGKGKDIAAVGEISVGDCYYGKGQLDKAVAHYDSAIKYEKYSAGALIPLAEIDYKKGNVAKAKQEVDFIHNYIGFSARSLYLSILINRDLGDTAGERDAIRNLRARYSTSEQAKSLMNP